jgi:hypothetical protein
LWTSFRNSCWFQKWEDLKGRNEGRKLWTSFIYKMYSFSIDFMYYNTFHQPHYELESNFCTLGVHTTVNCRGASLLN